MARGHLQNLANYLRHQSGTKDGRVQRKVSLSNGRHLLVKVRKSGSVLLTMLWENENHHLCLAVETRGTSEILLVGSDLRNASKAPAQPYVLKVIRHALNDAFPMYWYNTQEWSPPQKPINQRKLPADKGKRK